MLEQQQQSQRQQQQCEQQQNEEEDIEQQQRQQRKQKQQRDERQRQRNSKRKMMNNNKKAKKKRERKRIRVLRPDKEDEGENLPDLVDSSDSEEEQNNDDNERGCEDICGVCNEFRGPSVLCGAGIRGGVICPFTDKQPGVSSTTGVEANTEIHQEEGEEEANVRVPKSPVRPSKQAIEEHYARGHLPFRSWCEICVKAKGKENPHWSNKRGERDMPEVSIDYAFLKDEPGGESLTIVVIKCQGTKAIMAHPVMCKGRSTQDAVDDCVGSIKDLGYSRLIIKCDQEPALVDLRQGIIDAREFEVIPEHSPARD